jgi:hypothetical protein
VTLAVGTGRRVSLAVRFAARDHLVGCDLRLDHADRYALLVGIPFVSLKLTVRR